MPHKVLIVDDEPSLLRVLQVNLELEGYQTLLAGDGSTALQRIKSESPDLVLLDVMMPVMDGWQVLSSLSGAKRRPRIVVMTAKAGGHDLIKGLQLGADGYLTKPFEMEELITTVKETLSMTDAEAQAKRQALIEAWS